MRKIIFTAIAVFNIVFLFAQENKKDLEIKHIISIQAGVSFPSDDLSEISQADINTTSAASAASGITVGFDYQRNISQHFGFNVLLRAYTFPVDENTTLEDFKEDPSAIYSIDTEPYALGFLGLGFTAQYGKLVQGYVSPFIGYGGMRSPEIEIRETIGVNYEKITRDFDSDLSLMYGTNFGIRVQLTKSFLLGVNAEYLTSEKFDFNGDVSIQQNNNPSQDEPYEYEQAFSSFSLALRVGFTF